MRSPPASASVPSTITSTAPASSIRSITGANRPEIRVPASSACELALVLAPEARQLVLLRAGRLHERGVAERLLGDRGQRAGAAAALARGAAGEPGEAVRGEGEDRHDDQRGERELPREQEQRAAEEQDPRGGLHELAGGRQQERLDRVDVAGQAGEHVAVAAPVERVGLEPLQVGEEPACAARA